MNPTASDVYINPILTNISLAWMQDQSKYIADKVFPPVPVQLQSATYFVYSQDDFYRSEAQERAPSTESAGSGYRVTTAPAYYCRVNAIHKDVDDQLRGNSIDPLGPDRGATEWVSQQMLLKKEIDWVNNYFKTGVWGVDLGGVTSGPSASQFVQWDQANSTPINDMTAAVLAFEQRTGFTPNKLVLGPATYAALKNNAQILGRIIYTQRGMVTTDILSALFEIPEIYVAHAIQNTQAEGVTGSYSFLFGKGALLAYAPPAPAINVPSAGYSFTWNGYLGANSLGSRITSFRMEELKSDRVEGEMAYDLKVIANSLGTFFNATVA